MDCYSPIVVTVNKLCLVVFQTNKYSVPSEYAHQTVILKATTIEIKIYSNNKQIATHRRCYDKFQLIKNPHHYKKLLEQKHQAQVHITIDKFEQLSVESKSYLSVDKQGCDLFFQVISNRYEIGSVIITSNRHFREWGEIFNGDSMLI